MSDHVMPALNPRLRRLPAEKHRLLQQRRGHSCASHDCGATAQGDWEKEIHAGLPKASITAGARP